MPAARAAFMQQVWPTAWFLFFVGGGEPLSLPSLVPHGSSAVEGLSSVVSTAPCVIRRLQRARTQTNGGLGRGRLAEPRMEKTWGAKRERCQLELFDTKGEGIHSEQQEPFPSTKKELRKEERVAVGTEPSLLQGGGGGRNPRPQGLPCSVVRGCPQKVSCHQFILPLALPFAVPCRHLDSLLALSARLLSAAASAGNESLPRARSGGVGQPLPSLAGQGPGC